MVAYSSNVASALCAYSAAFRRLNCCTASEIVFRTDLKYNIWGGHAQRQVPWYLVAVAFGNPETVVLPSFDKTIDWTIRSTL